MKEHNIGEKISFVIDCVLAIAFLVFIIYHLALGMANHDAYYLVMAIIDYGLMNLNVKNIYNYLDIED